MHLPYRDKIVYNHILMSCLFASLALLVGALPFFGGSVRTAAEFNEFVNRGTPQRIDYTLTGQVLDTPKTNGFIVLADDTGRIELKCDRPFPSAGDLVILTGEIHLCTNMEFWTLPRDMRILGRKPLPAVKTLSLGELSEQRHDLHLIRTQGVVMDAFTDEIDSNYTFLLLKDGPNVIPIAIPRCLSIRPSELVDARISVTGWYHRSASGARKFSGPFISLGQAQDVQVIAPPPKDPFDVPELENSLYKTPREIFALGKRRATGTVIAFWGGNQAMIRLSTDRVIDIEFNRDAALPECGTVITAVGYPETNLFRIKLGKAQFRESDQQPIPDESPVDVTAEDILEDPSGHAKIDSDCHGRVIRIRGTVLSMPANGVPGPLLLNCGKYNISVDANARADVLGDLTAGYAIEVSGVCLLEADRWQPTNIFPHLKGFSVVVRPADSIRILQRPPWWTPQRFLVVIALLLALIALLFCWSVALKKVAERKGRQLFKAEVEKITSELKVGERTRLAVELHDAVSQNLTGVAMEVNAAMRTVDPGNAKTMRHLDLATKTLKSCRNELRNCLWDLRNDTLGENNLNEAIRQTVSSQVGDVSLSIRFNVRRSRLTDNTTHTILRIIRELAVNAVRHGNASAIKVAGSIEKDRLLFSVGDNGCGFDVERRPGILEGHFGLQGISERVASYNGKMSIRSAAGKGTKVTISMHLPNFGGAEGENE